MFQLYVESHDLNGLFRGATTDSDFVSDSGFLDICHIFGPSIGEKRRDIDTYKFIALYFAGMPLDESVEGETIKRIIRRYKSSKYRGKNFLTAQGLNALIEYMYRNKYDKALLDSIGQSIHITDEDIAMKLLEI